MRICINVKVFEWIFLPSSAHEYGYTNHLFRKNGGWEIGTTQFSFFCKYLFNGFYSGLDLDILT